MLARLLETDRLGQSLGRAALYLPVSARLLRFTQNKPDKAMLSAGLAWVTATLRSHVLGNMHSCKKPK